MDGANNLNRLFSSLVGHHRQTWQMLQSFEIQVQSKQIASCDLGLEAMEDHLKTHFAIEEQQLFSKAIGQPKLKEGGAFCTYYFDAFMNRRPLAQLTVLLKKIQPSFQQPKPTLENEKYFTTGSPLAIPCEEHLAILTLIQELRLELKLNKTPNWMWIEAATQLLTSWIKNNHEKEENCLFPHLSTLLS